MNVNGNKDRILTRYIVHEMVLGDRSRILGDFDLIPLSFVRAKLIHRHRPYGFCVNTSLNGSLPVLIIIYSIVVFTDTEIVSDRFEHEFEDDSVITDVMNIICEDGQLFKPYPIMSVFSSARHHALFEGMLSVKILQFI